MDEVHHGSRRGAKLSGAIEDSQEQKIIIADPASWEMIEERRKKGRTRSLASVRERFARKDAHSARQRLTKPKNKQSSIACCTYLQMAS
jgi:hypothetical protein